MKLKGLMVVIGLMIGTSAMARCIGDLRLIQEARSLAQSSTQLANEANYFRINRLARDAREVALRSRDLSNLNNGSAFSCGLLLDRVRSIQFEFSTLQRTISDLQFNRRLPFSVEQKVFLVESDFNNLTFASRNLRQTNRRPVVVGPTPVRPTPPIIRPYPSRPGRPVTPGRPARPVRRPGRTVVVL